MSVSRRTRSIARVAADVLITVGALVLLFAVYQLWWTNVQAARATASARTDIAASWEAATSPVVTVSPPADAGSAAGSESGSSEAPLPDTPETQAVPPIGKGFALMSIPRLADSVWEMPVIQGVSADELAKGIGHYPDTALPGQIGNFATAAHRATNGEPFKDFDRLKKGDRVVVETQDGWFVYELEKDKIVLPSDTWVIDPVPGDPGAIPTEALITLTTCNPRWASYERWIWWGTLVETRDRTQGPPAELAERGEA